MSRETERKINSHFKNLQELYYQTNPSMQVSIRGINLTGYHPPRHPGAFAPKGMLSPRAFAQQKMPGGRVNK